MTDTPAAARQRPLSPHLQVYRLPLPPLTSITHRITGIGLTAGTLLWAWWIISAAAGPDAFEAAQGFIGSWFGMILMFGWTWALWYHLLNGVRHLMWDAGRGLDLGTTYRTGYLVIGGSIGLTVITWIAVFAAM